MSRRAKIGFGVALLVLASAGGGVALLLWHGSSAREQPAAIEAFVARRLRRLAIPHNARRATNPVSATPDILAAARAHFADHCAICHANDGSGKTEIGKGLYPKAPDMRERDTQSLSDGELFYIIHNGIRFTGMPAWGDGDPAEDRDSWKLVHFIRHLPRLTEEELAEMKRWNPRGRQEAAEEEEIEKFLQGEDAEPTLPQRHH
jgi:mono/diheme cytochrome c family protein